MKRLPNPSVDSSLGVPEFPEKSCQNNWNPQAEGVAPQHSLCCGHWVDRPFFRESARLVFPLPESHNVRLSVFGSHLETGMALLLISHLRGPIRLAGGSIELDWKSSVSNRQVPGHPRNSHAWCRHFRAYGTDLGGG